MGPQRFILAVTATWVVET